jgi:hypothetical protein
MNKKDVYIEGVLSPCGEASSKEEAIDTVWKHMSVSAKLKHNRLNTTVDEYDDFYSVELM